MAEGTRAAEIDVAVGSGNPVKARAVRSAFEAMFPEARLRVEAVEVASGVAEQPRTDAETLAGARRRADAALAALPRAGYGVGIEGGVEDTADGMLAFAWVSIARPGAPRCEARSGSFRLPERIAELVRAGRELGEADDLVFGRSGSKREEGAIGLLTGGVVDRTALYRHAVALALAPLRSPGLYSSTTSRSK